MRTIALTLLFILASLGAGCIGGDDDALEADHEATLVDEIAVPEAQFDTFHDRIEVSVGTPVLSYNQGQAGSFSRQLPIAKQVTGWILELEWEPRNPASESLDLWVRKAEAGIVPTVPQPPLAAAKGTSPLRIVLHDSDLEKGADYFIIMRAHSDPAGAALNQAFELHTITFVNMPVDESLSALGGPAH